MRTAIAALFMSLLAPVAHSQSAAADAAPSAALPAMRFAATICSDEIYDALKGNQLFASLDKTTPGSAILIRVSHIYGRNSASTASDVASLIFAVGSLGLLPAMSNKDLTMVYEVVVNGSPVIAYKYSKGITHVFNIHATDKSHGLGADGLAWVTETARQFAADLSQDARFAELRSEYHYYFDAVPVASAAFQ
jgi:hypothetical protein